MTEQGPSDPDGDGASEPRPEQVSPGDVGREDEDDREGNEPVTPAASDAPDEGDDSAVDEELIERIEREDPESIAREIATLTLEVDGLEAELDEREAEIDELTSKVKRKQADFENYKKRMKQRREDEKRRATGALVERLLDVRDNLQRALDQDEDVDIRDGVESTLRQFDDVLAAENVEPIEPKEGDEVDPHRHEVLTRIDAREPEGTIALLHRRGYEMGDTVLREAQVAVSDGSPDEDGADDEANWSEDGGSDEANWSEDGGSDEPRGSEEGAGDEASETEGGADGE